MMKQVIVFAAAAFSLTASAEGDWRSGDNDIEDILIEDLDGGERGYTAVRLLSRNARVRNVTIRNIHGKFQNNLSLTLEDVKQKIPDAKPLLKIADTARIGRLTR